MVLKGLYYDGDHAGSQEIKISIDDQGMLHATPELIEPQHIRQVSISRRIGNIPRSITFESGSMFETSDHEKLDIWLKEYGLKESWAHRLESNMRFVIGALISVSAIVVWGAIWGIPWASTRVANALPAEMSSYISRGTMETLDKRVFAETQLDESQQDSLSKQFQQLIPLNSEAIDYRLVFRRGGFIGANAFALPDGTVVITDELIKLARRDEEIISILLHEIGHVEHRHSLRQVISHSSLVILTLLITGDISSAGTLVVALPNVLVETSYSRTFESEADSYALEQMQQRDIPTDHFADIMERLEYCSVHILDEAELQDGTDCEIPEGYDNTRANNSDWFSYISTHPANKERIARFRSIKK